MKIKPTLYLNNEYFYRSRSRKYMSAEYEYNFELDSECLLCEGAPEVDCIWWVPIKFREVIGADAVHYKLCKKHLKDWDEDRVRQAMIHYFVGPLN